RAMTAEDEQEILAGLNDERSAIQKLSDLAPRARADPHQELRRQTLASVRVNAEAEIQALTKEPLVRFNNPDDQIHSLIGNLRHELDERAGTHVPTLIAKLDANLRAMTAEDEQEILAGLNDERSAIQKLSDLAPRARADPHQELRRQTLASLSDKAKEEIQALRKDFLERFNNPDDQIHSLIGNLRHELDERAATHVPTLIAKMDANLRAMTAEDEQEILAGLNDERSAIQK
ncbi:hypothetical protein, partial [Ensifer sp. NM-2]|uniref:hypothetical protein n=1 Tax=Ensifer sp. NM-2 TaxID=2109730 RepID=UPI001304AA12